MTDRDFVYIGILVLFLIIILFLMYILLIRRNFNSTMDIEYKFDHDVYLHLKDGTSLDEFFQSMNSYDFEVFISDLYNSLGYKTNVTKKTRDGGRDIEMKYGFKKYFVECKKYKYDRKVNISDVQRFSSVILDAKVRGKIVTTGKFTKPAILYAKSKNIELITIEKIKELLKLTSLKISRV